MDTHYHGLAYFERLAVWQLVCTSEDYRRCATRLQAQLRQEPRWKNAEDTTVRRCFRANSDCPYWHAEDWVH